MLKDAGLPFTKDAAQAKLLASEAATFCSHQAIQVCFRAVASIFTYVLLNPSCTFISIYIGAGRYGIRVGHAC